MPAANDRSRTLIAESPIERLERAFELERVFERDVKDTREIATAQLLERLLSARVDRASTSPNCRAERDITNLLEDALEDEAPESKLTQVAVAVGLLLASLDAPPCK